MDLLEKRVTALESAVKDRDARIAHLEAYIKSLESESTSVGKWDGNTVRQTFIDFFAEKGHTHWPSSSVVPHEVGVINVSTTTRTIASRGLECVGLWYFVFVTILMDNMLLLP